MSANLGGYISATFNPLTSGVTATVEYLVVAGGAGGQGARFNSPDYRGGGGGGAGGLLGSLFGGGGYTAPDAHYGGFVRSGDGSIVRSGDGGFVSYGEGRQGNLEAFGDNPMGTI